MLACFHKTTFLFYWKLMRDLKSWHTTLSCLWNFFLANRKEFLLDLGRQLQLIGLNGVQREGRKALAPYPVFLTGQWRTRHLPLVWHRPSPSSSHLCREKTVSLKLAYQSASLHFSHSCKRRWFCPRADLVLNRNVNLARDESEKWQPWYRSWQKHYGRLVINLLNGCQTKLQGSMLAKTIQDLSFRKMEIYAPGPRSFLERRCMIWIKCCVLL